MKQREIKFEYGFSSVNGIVKKVYYLHEIPSIKEKCDLWGELPIAYIREYMGRKDKNGKDIFQGDILKTEKSIFGILDNKNNVHEVFSSDQSKFITKTWDDFIVAEFKITPNFISFELPKEDGTYQNRGKELKWEIVGNIYENPNLIPNAK